MLDRRYVQAAGVYFPPGTDQATIPMALIAATQALPGGDWGIVDGVGATSSTTRELAAPAGKSINKVITDLARLENGFEWEVDPTLTLNRWYPVRGSDLGRILDFGGLIGSVSGQLDPADFANVATAIAGEGLTPAVAATDDVATDERGRWETVESFPTVSLQATLDAKAPW